MATAPAPPSGTSPSRNPLVPCLLLKHGEVYLPAENGPEPARDGDGGPPDPFDVVDRLAAEYPLIYLVDLDGVERGEPQLDFLQELARDAVLWVDGGVRTADQAIDILVTGARRAVLSSAILRGPKELRRAWRLSSELVFELEIDRTGVVLREDWDVRDPLALAAQIREIGIERLVVSPREVEPDWTLVRAIAAGGRTWVDGSFEPQELPQLQASGARGGIFHIGALLNPVPTKLTEESPLRTTTRDDEA